MKMFTLLQAGEVVEVAPVAANEAVQTIAEVADVEPASAAAEGQPNAKGMNMWLMPALLIGMIIFMFASQRKQQKKVQNFQDSLKKGDKVVTVGGIYGTICEVKEKSLLIEVDNGVKIRVSKQAISSETAE